MIRIAILYPNTDGARFDLDYYANTHMPMAIALLGAQRGFRGVSVERGVAGATPGAAPAYIAMCHYLFDSIEEFMAAFIPNAPRLRGDMPNYTDIEPLIQFNEVLLASEFQMAP